MSSLQAIAVTANPHYTRLGGHAAVVRLVDAFYGAMDERADAKALRAMHAADLAPTKAVLVTFLAEWLGGPKRYTAERGAPRLRRVHGPFAIDAPAARAWLVCMQQALDGTCADGALRAELIASFTKVATHLQNAAPHAHPHDHHRSP